MTDITQFSTTRKEIDIDLIYPNPWNPNIESEVIFEKLKKNIQEYGFNDPVLVTARKTDLGEYIIIDGEHRWKAAKALGFKTVIAEEMVDIKTGNPVDDFDIEFLTIQMNNLRGEDDTVKRGLILKTLKENRPDSLPNLSLFPDQIENEIKAIDFKMEYSGEKPTLDTMVTISFKVHAAVADFVNRVLEAVDPDQNKAFLKLIKDEAQIKDIHD